MLLFCRLFKLTQLKVLYNPLSESIPKTTASKTKLSTNVPRTVNELSPAYWSDIELYQVTPRPTPNYLGKGSA